MLSLQFLLFPYMAQSSKSFRHSTKAFFKMLFSVFSRKDKSGSSQQARDTPLPQVKVVEAEPEAAPTKAEQTRTRSLSQPRTRSASSGRSSLREMGSRVKQSRFFRNAGYDEHGNLRPEYERTGIDPHGEDW